MTIGGAEIGWAVLGATATGIIGGIGFLLKRWITAEGSKERVAELSTLATVASQMRAAGVSFEEVEALKRYLRDGHRSEETTASLVGTGPERTQLELNDAAALELKKLDDEMSGVLAEIKTFLDEAEVAELNRAQGKWEEFRQAHAEFVSRIFEGGGMQPLWYITTVDIATRDRLDELKSYLDVRRHWFE
jgi:uncharacterized protein YecT (DUF1311 family)